MFIKLLDIKNRIMVGVMMTLAAAMGGLVPTQEADAANGESLTQIAGNVVQNLGAAAAILKVGFIVGGIGLVGISIFKIGTHHKHKEGVMPWILALIMGVLAIMLGWVISSVSVSVAGSDQTTSSGLTN